MEVRVTHISPVHKEELRCLLRGGFGFAHKPVNRHQLGLLLYLKQLRCIKFALALAEHTLYTLLVRGNRQVV